MKRAIIIRSLQEAEARQKSSFEPSKPQLSLVHGAKPEEPIATHKLYLNQLKTPASRRTMMVLLTIAAHILRGEPETETQADTDEKLNRIHWELLRARDVKRVVDRMVELDYAGATINTTLAGLKGIAREAWLDERMSVDDHLRIQAVKKVEWKQIRPHSPLQPEELLLLMNACMSDRKIAAGIRDWAVITLLGGAGLRRSEAAALTLDNLVDGPYTLHVRGKGKNDRIAYLKDEGAREALDAWLRIRNEEDNHLLQQVDQTGIVQPRKISDMAIYRLLRKRGEEAGVRAFTPHDLRYTFATTLIGATGDIHTVQALLGHATIETTTTYDKRPEEEKERTAGYIHFPSARPRSKRKPRSAHRRSRRRGPRTPIKYSKKMMLLAQQLAERNKELN